MLAHRGQHRLMHINHSSRGSDCDRDSDSDVDVVFGGWAIVWVVALQHVASSKLRGGQRLDASSSNHTHTHAHIVKLLSTLTALSTALHSIAPINVSAFDMRARTHM